MFRSTTTSTAEEFRSEECSSSGTSISKDLLIHHSFRTTRRHEASVFSLTSEEEEEDVVQFDTTDIDDSREVLMTGQHYPSIQEFASAIPNQLLLGSLLEHLCVVYERDPTRSHMLFKAIGQRLAAMNLLSPLAISDEFSTIRLQHNRAFTELLHAASSSLVQDPQLLGTDTQELTVRPKEGLFQAQTSRYLSEFEEICRLGKGSYGKVFKVTNKLDGQNYAVKKILIKSVSRQDCMKVLREVKVLSSLQHVNVVGYHTAWMEHVQPAVSSQPALPSLKSPTTQEGTDENRDSSGSGSSIVFQNSSNPEPDAAIAANGAPTETVLIKALVSIPDRGQVVCPKTMRRIPEHYVPCAFLGERQNGPVAPSSCPAVDWDDSDPLDEDSSEMRAELNNNSCIGMEGLQWLDTHAARRSFGEVQFHLMLYIQMQLCEHSLKDWISERNARATDQLASRCPYGGVDPDHTLGLLRKILEGVEYIHSRGIMHRDLKPRNIFLHGHDYHVRIGDFGLACRDIIVDESLPSSPHNTGSSHTTGVGTFVYAAPEQLQGTHYDSKSDMYSIGVVAFELFQPFGTEMERVRTLENLREGKIPDAFCQRWPVLAKHVTQLTSKDPRVRPDATQLLCSELFSSKDMVINGLQRRVEEQEEELIQLRRQISELQSSQNNVENSDRT